MTDGRAMESARVLKMFERAFDESQSWHSGWGVRTLLKLLKLLKLLNALMVPKLGTDTTLQSFSFEQFGSRREV